MKKYEHINFKPTESMAKAAQRGLDMRDKQPDSNKGMTSVGLTRARQLIARETLSPETVKRMHSFFSRHEVDKSSESWKKGDSKGEQAWLGWGGDAGQSWAAKIVKQMESADEKSSAKNVLKQESDGWHIYSEEGKKLGGPYSKEKAEERLKQIEIFKHMKGNSMRLNRVDKLYVNQNVSKRRVRGKDMIVISGAVHAIKDSVMNGIFYPGEEIEALCNKLEGRRIPVPVSHPTTDDGAFLSANDPLALMSNYIGAYAENFSMKGDKLISDILIDPDMAAMSDGGKDVLACVEDEKDLDASTGVYFEPVNNSGVAPDGEDYDRVATNMDLDHTALLPYEPGAKQSNEGVGLFANSALDKDGNEIDMVTFEANASAAGRNYPVADSGTKWDASTAEKRIREFSKSDDKPSTNYRKFFMWFDRDNPEDFGSYKLPFVDIVDGRPKVIPKALAAIKGSLSGARGETVDIPNADKKAVETLVSHYEDKAESASNSKKGLIGELKSAINRAKDALASLNGYNTDSGVDAAFNKSEEDQRMDKKKLMGMMQKYGNMDKEKMDNMSDDEMMNAMERMFKTAGDNMKAKNEDDKDPSREDMKKEQDKMAKGNSEDMPSWAKSIVNKIESLETTVNSSQEAERKPLIEMAVNMGISEAGANAMSTDDLKSFASNHSPAASFLGSPFMSAGNSKQDDYDAPDAL